MFPTAREYDPTKRINSMHKPSENPERDQFEARMIEQYGYGRHMFERSSTGDYYTSNLIFGAWEAWRAAISLPRRAESQPYVDADGCPTEIDVLKRFWRENQPQASMGDAMRDFIEGMSVSVDVSTNDKDAGNRYFGTVTEVMDDPGDKHGVTLLVQDARPNFSPAAPRVVSDGTMTVLREGRFITPENRREIIAALDSIAPVQHPVV